MAACGFDWPPCVLAKLGGVANQPVLLNTQDTDAEAEQLGLVPPGGVTSTCPKTTELPKGRPVSVPTPALPSTSAQKGTPGRSSDESGSKRERVWSATGNRPAIVRMTPTGIVATPNGRWLYVANNNNYGTEGGGGASVSVLNASTGLLQTTISHSSFNEPYAVAIDAAGRLVYVTNSNSTTVTVIDTRSNKVVDVIPGFDGPSGFAITPDQKRAYVNNYGTETSGKTVNVVDLRTRRIVGSAIPVDLLPSALTVSPNGKYVLVVCYVDGNPKTGMANLIDTSTNKVITKTPGLSGPFDVVISPDSRSAYVTNFGSNNFSPIGTTLAILSLRDRQVRITSSVELGIQPSGLALTTDGRYAIAVNYNAVYAGDNFTDLTPGEGTLSIVDTRSLKVVAPTVRVGQGPHGVVLIPDEGNMRPVSVGRNDATSKNTNRNRSGSRSTSTRVKGGERKLRVAISNSISNTVTLVDLEQVRK